MAGGFYFAKFQINLRLTEKVDLPAYLGSTIRGAFGSVLRNLVCPLSKEKDCKPCPINARCLFAYLFITPKDKELNISYEYKEYPHPYVIEPPNTLDSDDNISFHLILFGKGIDYLPYFVLAFERLRLGRRKVKCWLESITDTLSIEKSIVFDGLKKRFVKNFVVKNFDGILAEVPKTEIADLTIQFLTPTRIKYWGEMRESIDFEILMRNILRRFIILSEFHCNFKPGLNIESLLSKAKDIKTFESQLLKQKLQRYSSRQGKTIDFSGFVGKITFQGKMNEFLPYIKLGEYIHIGKNTSFGFGQYKILNLTEKERKSSN